MEMGGVSGETRLRSPFCSGVCDWCSGPNDGAKNYYLCAGCYVKWQGESGAAPAFHQSVQLTKEVKATTGHIKDIKSRKLAEDGRSVERNSGRNPIYSFGGL